ncbi:MAG: TerC family protein [Rhodospirillaceae bacterium]|nr:TerC family protein [Rhodospirillaceae bacterium]
MEWIFDPQIWIALVTLTALEIVLGIDNIVVIAIVAGRLPPDQRARARLIGLSGALVTRLLLLLTLTWLASLTEPWITVAGLDFSGRDLILMVGGMFLIAKGTKEIHERVEEAGSQDRHRPAAGFAAAVFQIILIDIVFSFDSVVTAVGMARDLGVMVVAVIIAVLVMLAASGTIVRFIDAHPTIKMLALSFLLLIGTALVAEGLSFDIPKGYLYFAMAFSVLVEALNIQVSRRRKNK